MLKSPNTNQSFLDKFYNKLAMHHFNKIHQNRIVISHLFYFNQNAPKIKHKRGTQMKTQCWKSVMVPVV